MGSLFRSERMQLSELILHCDNAYRCIAELGELGIVQFKDCQSDVSAFQRKFVNEVRRCDEMERKLRFTEKEIKKDDFPIPESKMDPEAPSPPEMIELENNLLKIENELKEVNSNQEQLKKTYLEVTEMKHILRKTRAFFEESSRTQNSLDENTNLLGEDGIGVGVSRLGFLAGIISRDRLAPFEKMLWRVCRGNIFMKQAEVEAPLEDPVTGNKMRKSVFVIFFQGEQLKSRVNKICEGFHANLYPCPDSADERAEMTSQVVKRTEDLERVLSQTQLHRNRILEAAAQNLREWFIKVRKIKAIYHTLNLFKLDPTTKCMVGEYWSAVDNADTIKQALRRGVENTKVAFDPITNPKQTKEKPPTYHRANKFTEGFQSIVDAYGVARYREVNPALFTVITFPFLFSVMFGDAGHGLIMFLFALWMVVREKELLKMKTTDEIWNTFFGGRYIILLMGAFSIHSGLIYNDVFSKSMNIFGSSWYPNFTKEQIEESASLQLEPAIGANYTQMYTGYPYAFGVDPIWQLAQNKITFTNSMKMKMSIVFGVIHMVFGVSLSLFNYSFFNDRLSIFCVFIPQLIFLLGLFGYLVLMIFYKWCSYDATMNSTAPSLLLMLINMIPGSGGSSYFYPGQQGLQNFILLVEIVCMFWMLLSKPLILLYREKQKAKASRALHKHDDESVGNSTTALHKKEKTLEDNESDEEADIGGHGDEDGKFDFGDTMVFSAIHTIEYCLGCVSNTASYLRLWALSLAHSQLSEVLWNMVMQMGTKVDASYGCIVLFFIFAFWAILTVGVLILMEGLSAFLHAIRLHWVEFNNKFYEGSGHLFVPFSFETYLKQSEEMSS